MIVVSVFQRFSTTLTKKSELWIPKKYHSRCLWKLPQYSHVLINCLSTIRGFPNGSVSKRMHLQCRRCGLDPWVGKILWKVNGNSLHYACLENPMGRRAWQGTVQGVTRVRYDLATKSPLLYLLRSQRLEFLKSIPPGTYGSYLSTHMCIQTTSQLSLYYSVSSGPHLHYCHCTMWLTGAQPHLSLCSQWPLGTNFLLWTLWVLFSNINSTGSCHVSWTHHFFPDTAFSSWELLPIF